MFRTPIRKGTILPVPSFFQGFFAVQLWRVCTWGLLHMLGLKKKSPRKPGDPCRIAKWCWDGSASDFLGKFHGSSGQRIFTDISGAKKIPCPAWISKGSLPTACAVQKLEQPEKYLAAKNEYRVGKKHQIARFKHHPQCTSSWFGSTLKSARVQTANSMFFFQLFRPFFSKKDAQEVANCFKASNTPGTARLARRTVLVQGGYLVQRLEPPKNLSFNKTPRRFSGKSTT